MKGYKLAVNDGKVKYIYRSKDGEVSSDTKAEAAEWMLDQVKPEPSKEYPGYPIAVNMNNNEYYFAGTWA